MRLPAKIIWFILWTVCTAEDCQEPPPSGDTEILFGSWPDEAYPEGTLAISACQIGYGISGPIIKACRKGEWVALIPGWSCQKQSCGHPGDTPFGSFHLAEGNEFEYGAKVVYTCDEGYQMLSENNFRECGPDGWTNDIPICGVKPCDFPEIKYGRVFYEERDIPYFPVPIGVQYAYCCDNGFVTPSQSNEDFIHCTKEGWVPEVPCLRECILNYVENGHSPDHERRYTKNQSVKVDCYPGYSLPNKENTITCTEDGWSPLPKCVDIKVERQSCPPPPQIPNAEDMTTRMKYQDGEKVSVLCKENYQIQEAEEIVCKNGRWQPIPRCVDISCGNPPRVENAKMISNQKVRYPSGERVRYECIKPFEIFGEVEVMCLNGTWTEPPQCKDSTGKCGPPPPIDNGDLTSFPLRVYPPGSSVEYQCQSLYQLQGSKKILCRDGKWSEPPKCLNACVISEEIMERHNISLKGKEKKRYSVSGDSVEFMCKYGYYPLAGQLFHTKCIDGHVEYPRCTKK